MFKINDKATDEGSSEPVIENPVKEEQVIEEPVIEEPVIEEPPKPTMDNT